MSGYHKSSLDFKLQMHIPHSFPECILINIHPVLQPDVPPNNFYFSTLFDIKINCIIDDVVHG